MKTRLFCLILTGLMVAPLAARAQQQTSWSDNLSLKGDLRLREEGIDQDGKATRWRTRLRARLALKAKVNDEIDARFRFASGSDDPVSSNQTLGDGFSSKDFRLDRAYFDWHPEVVEHLHLRGGKMPVPFVRIKDLIWDGDLNPEGVAAQYTLGADELELLLSGAVFLAEERSAAADTTMYGGQAVLKLKPEAFTVLAGAGYYFWDNMAGFPTLYDSLKGFGNTTEEVVDPVTGETTELLYANDFSIVEGLAKVSFHTDIPISLYANAVVNTEANGEDTGYLVGGTIGKTKKPGSMALDYNYRDLEADAVVGAFTDSDSGGGGTGVKGHRVQAKLQLAEHWQLSATLFFNTLADGTDYTRGQFDLIAKF